MTENEALNELRLQSIVLKSRVQANREIEEFVSSALLEQRKNAIDMAIQALEEIQQYRDLKQRLKNVYGECDGLLEVVVSALERHENLDLPYIEVKSVLLINEDVDKWDEYRAIGTIEEFKALKEKSEPKKVVKQGYAFLCPTCKRSTLDGIGLKSDWCPKCGQHLDWFE